MFRDTEEELARLQEALQSDDDREDCCADDAEAQTDDGASDYDAYNTDVTDTDLDAYSEEVRQSQKGSSLTGLIAIAFVLLTAIVCVLLWWLLRYGGLAG